MISYDIPIAFNRERNILRDILRMLGFNLIHKSVWIGKVLLPERFVGDLIKLGILDYVEILEVAKNGTLKSKNWFLVLLLSFTYVQHRNGKQ